MRSHSRLLLIAAGCAWGAAFGPPIVASGGAPTATATANGTRRMVQRLQELAAAADPAKNPYLNKQRADRCRTQLLAAANPSAATQARVAYARELLLAGDSEGAIQELELIQQKIDQAGGASAFPNLAPVIRRELGMSYLRLGEQENCIAHHGAESCVLPIQGAGVYTQQRGPRRAVEVFTASLQANPKDYESLWLLNVAAMTLGEYPSKVPSQWLIPPSCFTSEYDIKRFTDIAPLLGVDTFGHAGGGIMEDFDRDGDLDIMSSSLGLKDQIRYFVNGGDGTFTERTAAAGLTGLTGGINLAHADYDNDGYPDVLVIRGAWLDDQGLHPESLLRNLGDGTFADVTEAAGLLVFHPTHSASWADYDNDGWLDLFLGHETRGTTPHPCQLFHNNHDGTFTECAAQAGVANVGFVKGTTWGDYNNDDLPDLYVSRLGQPNVLYRNDGPAPSGSPAPAWRFTDVSATAGVTEPKFSFPTWFFDYDNDGWQDLIALGYSWTSVGDQARDYLGVPHPAELPRLYRNKHDGTFADVTVETKLNRLLITMGCNYGDLDNDGYLDFYCGTGDPDLRSIVPNRMFRNAEGKRFQDVTSAGGFGHLQKGHGVAFGDLDQDGDQDIFEEMGGAVEGDAFHSALYLNPGHGHHWITLLLEGVTTNRSALGARIRVRVTDGRGGRDIYATVGTGGSFGCNSLQQEIGLGDSKAIDFIEVRWPARKQTQRFEGVAMDRYYSLREGEVALVALDRKPIAFKVSTSTDTKTGAAAHAGHAGHDGHKH